MYFNFNAVQSNKADSSLLLINDSQRENELGSSFRSLESIMFVYYKIKSLKAKYTCS